MKIGVSPLPPDWWSSLTPDEQRIARLITEGLTNRQIAEELNLTVEAVKDQILVIPRKARATSRVQLALAILRNESAP